MKRILEHYLDKGLPDMALWDCHNRGIDSIVLDYSPQAPIKMTRMFVAWPNQRLWSLLQPDGNYTVAVHNHRYDLRIRTILGSIVNYEVTTGGIEGERPLYEFPFTSGINGEMRLGDPRRVSIDKENYRILNAGDQLVMAAEDLHTVIVPKSRNPVAWIVEEWEDRIAPLLYSPLPNPSVSSEGLYGKMEAKAARAMVNMISDLL